MDEKEQKIIDSITSITLHKPEGNYFNINDAFFTAKYKIEDGDKLTKEEQEEHNKIISSYIRKNMRLRLK
tara:strand:- start:1908 stop:2117 length:210 start_codon:yes stop_codon:yes gene_type:complete